jgi:beta-lactamase regulating signal transducer with metallopeptidase domain
MTDFFATAEPAGLVDLAVRATILLFVSLVLQWLVRRWPAATRHHLWTLAFVLLLALPAVRQFGPSWEWPLLPGVERPRDAVVPLELSRVAEAPSGVAAAQRSALVIEGTPGGGVRRAHPSRPWVRLGFLIWAAGSAVAFVSLGVSAWRFSRLVRAGQPVDDEAWLSQLDALQKRLSTRATVRLVLARETVTPMTGGVCRPVILFPPSATGWSEDRRHAVLVHELVHVRRRDVLRQLLCHTVLAVYWFHPLSWAALRLAGSRREEACDEGVLAMGAKPSEYAGHLLSLAEGGALRRPALLLPMAHQSQLEKRVRAILRPHQARPRASIVAAALAVATVGGVSVSIADPTRPERSPVADEEAVGGDAAMLHCAPASAADELSGWDFGHGVGELLVCMIQGDTVTARAGVRTIEPAGWLALESEIRKQLERRSAAPP